MIRKDISKFRSVAYDLSRMNEWWLLSMGMIFFAFIPNIYAAGNSIGNEYYLTMDTIIDFLMAPDLYLAIIIVFCVQIFLFASNDYFDRDVDALDPKKKKRNPVCDGRVTIKGVRALLIATAIIPLLASLYFYFYAPSSALYNRPVDAPTSIIWPFLFTALTLFVYYFYTAPPLRFKNKVGLDVLSHGTLINTFPYFFCLVALEDYTIGTLFLLAILMMRSSMAQILQEIRDYEVDKKVETNTVIAIGQKRAIWLVFSINLLLLGSSIFLIVSYELTGWGVSLYYLILPLLSITYIPTLFKLLKVAEYGDNIEKLWMGQGRENFWQIAQYLIAFAIHIPIVAYLAMIHYQ